jgi:hypothetical protein
MKKGYFAQKELNKRGNTTNKENLEKDILLGKRAEEAAKEFNNTSNICAKSFLKFIDTERAFESVLNLFEEFSVKELSNLCVNVQEHKCSKKRCLREIIKNEAQEMECKIGFPLPSSGTAFI